MERKRVALSEQQRCEIAQRHINFPHLTHENLAQLAASTFELKVSRSAVSKLLKKKPRCIGKDKSHCKSDVKRLRKPKFVALEKALASWLWKTENAALISDDMVAEKAKELAKDPRLGVSDSMKLSSGWLQSFKRRFGISSYYLHGESGSASEEDASRMRRQLQDSLSECELKNIYSMNEAGLFCRMSPRRSLAAAQRVGKKKSKDRVTLALRCNADGSDKLQPLAIGKSKNPRCFKNVRRETLGADYCNSRSARATGGIFESWIKKLAARVRGRKAALLVDNASSHRVIFDELEQNGDLHQLKFSGSLLVAFFPPSMTSALQPMDAGMIASAKAHCRSIFLKWRLSEIEEGRESSKLSALQAIRFVTRSWRRIEDYVISSCFRHTKILTESQSADCRIQYKRSSCGIEKELLDIITSDLQGMKLDDALGPFELACPPEEKEIEAATSSEDIIKEALGKANSGEEAGVEEDSDVEAQQEAPQIPKVTNAQLDYCIDKICSCFEQAEVSYSAVWEALDEAVTIYDCYRARSRKQKKITDFLWRDKQMRILIKFSAIFLSANNIAAFDVVTKSYSHIDF